MTLPPEQGREPWSPNPDPTAPPTYPPAAPSYPAAPTYPATPPPFAAPPAYPGGPGYDQPGYQPPSYEPPTYQQPAYQQPPYQPAPYPPPTYPQPPAQPGYPAPYSGPPAGPGGYQTYPAAPGRKAGTNGLAIAAFVLGLCAGFPIAFILCLVFGIMALSQLRKVPQGGKGLAIAGLSLAGLWAIGIAVAVVISIVNSDGSTNVSVNRLNVGDCVNNLVDDKEVGNLPRIPCAQPHDGEVFAVFDLPAGAFPGDAKVEDLADDGCNDRLAGYSTRAVDDDDVGLFYLLPTAATWRTNDRSVICIATTDTKRTGSLKD